jgi:hypothetical protein
MERWLGEWMVMWMGMGMELVWGTQKDIWRAQRWVTKRAVVLASGFELEMVHVWDAILLGTW